MLGDMDTEEIKGPDEVGDPELPQPDKHVNAENVTTEHKGKYRVGTVRPIIASTAFALNIMGLSP